MEYDYSIVKYPRTPHLQGSRLQAGDEDLSQVSFDSILGKNIVIEEKIDGANTAVSFDGNGNLLLQSRGHYLIGGYRERHYNLFKQWANANVDILFEALSDRYVMYGEWMYAKHAVFYDALPDYFMEFDVYDRENKVFLDTPSRRAITEKMGIITSVPVLGSGVYKTKESILAHLGNSNYITENHIDVLRLTAERLNLDVERAVKETDPSLTMEGLYVKVEEGGIVESRLKFVRASFIQSLMQAEGHWLNKPIIPNQLKNGNF